MDVIISNEDVQNSKPHPEMYWNAISKMKCLPEETLIVEDSPYGLLAASRTNSFVLRVKNPKDVTYNNISKKILTINCLNIYWHRLEQKSLLQILMLFSSYHTY